MKAKLGITCFLILLLSSSVQAEEIPGGIVFSDGKDAIYQEFKTGKKTNLTLDFSRRVTGPVAVSEDVTMLVWLSSSRLFARYLPDGTPFRFHSTKKIENLSIAPENDYVAFEVGNGVKIIPIKRYLYRNNCSYQLHPKSYKDFYFPVWLKGKIPPIIDFPEEAMPKIIEKIRTIGWKNIADNGVLIKVPGKGPKKRTQLIRVKQLDRDHRMISALALRMDPQGEPKIALLYKDASTEKWGPIGIESRSRDLSGSKIPLQKEFFAKNCQGFKGRPDGIITWLFDEKVYSEDGKVIAQGIRGSNFSWITNDSFIFRSRDRALYLWKQGKQKKLLNFVPKQFSYCFRSPAATSGKNVLRWNGDFYLGDFEFSHCTISRYGRTRIFKDDAGKLFCHFLYRARSLPREKLVIPGRTGYLLIPKTGLKDIPDPSQYQYTEHIARKRINLPMNQILLLRKGKKYLTIKLIEAGHGTVPCQKYYHKLGANTDEKGSFIVLFFPRSLRPKLLYEWKYWPGVPLKKK